MSLFVIYVDAERKKESKLCAYKERRRILLEKGNVEGKKRRKQGCERKERRINRRRQGNEGVSATQTEGGQSLNHGRPSFRSEGSAAGHIWQAVAVRQRSDIIVC